MIQYLELQKENNENFLLFRLTKDNFNEICRIWVDKFTAKGFQEAFHFIPPFRDLNKNEILEYYYAGISGGLEPHQEMYVEIRLKEKKYKFKTFCSTFFSTNIIWLLETTNPAELNYLIYC